MRQVALYLAALLLIIVTVVGAIKDKVGPGFEWRSIGKSASLSPAAYPCQSLEGLKRSLDLYMKGGSTSPRCADSDQLDRSDAWKIVGKQDFSLQIESEQTGKRYWVIPEWLVETSQH